MRMSVVTSLQEKSEHREETMRRAIALSSIALSGIALSALAITAATAVADEAPRFQVDASWPRPLPNNWIMGQAAGVAVDAQDHVWVIQRPRSLTNDEKAATLNPPSSKCCVPAPPVMEFDPEGKLVQAWGGPGQGF